MHIGIAGLIGSGKSAVAKLLVGEGFSVIWADDEVHVLYRENAELRAQIAQAFGADMLTEEGVHRAKLGSLVFQDPAALRQLESIIHPVLARHLVKKITDTQGHVFIEGALLPCWPNLLKVLDQVWMVDANPEIRLARVVARGLPVEEAQKRMALQDQFPPLIHPQIVVIPNEKSLEELQALVLNLLKTQLQ